MKLVLNLALQRFNGNFHLKTTWSFGKSSVILPLGFKLSLPNPKTVQAVTGTPNYDIHCIALTRKYLMLLVNNLSFKCFTVFNK